MNILLVIPKYALTNKKHYNFMFPVGLGYISSIIKREGYNLDCLNLNFQEGTSEEIINKFINNKNYDIICTGGMGVNFDAIKKIMDSAKKFPKIKIILGGAIITSEPELIFKELGVDYGILGEGEITIIELLKCIEKNGDLKKVDGIIYKDENNNIIITKNRSPIEDIDSLPYPDFEGLGYDEQLENSSSNDALYSYFDYPRTYTVLGSRSCPYQCTFCYHSIGSKYRTRKIDSIIKEIEFAIKRFRVNTIFIYDDLFAVKKERIYDFCNKIKKLIDKTPWEIKWVCSLSVNNIDKDILKLIRDSGCLTVGFGFESYSQDVLNSMKKPITPQQIDYVIKLCNEINMPITGNFIFGDIAETNETAHETLEYWKKNADGQLQIGFIQPYPGSAIYNHCIKEGIIKDKLDYIKNHMSHTNWINMTKQMSDNDIDKLKREILDARRKYGYYIIPQKIKKMNKDRYELKIKCPHCKTIIDYKNCFLDNKHHFNISIICRECKKRFFAVSRLYKIGSDYYYQLDFFRRNYLLIRDKTLKKRV